MTVKELIEALQKHDLESEVRIMDTFPYTREIDGVFHTSESPGIYSHTGIVISA